MAEPKRPAGGRWDGWDDPDYEPTDDEFNEPVAVNATAEELAAAVMRQRPPSGD